jgi:hypothetical protein
VSGFYLSVVCPRCAGPVHHLNGNAHGLLSVAIVGCAPCRREWTVTVRLAPLESPETAAARVRQRRHRASVMP